MHRAVFPYEGMVCSLAHFFAFFPRYFQGLGPGAPIFFCRNVLFVCSVVCLFASVRAETVSTVAYHSSVGITAPMADVVSTPAFIVHSVTPFEGN